MLTLVEREAEIPQYDIAIFNTIYYFVTQYSTLIPHMLRFGEQHKIAIPQTQYSDLT